MDEWCVCRICAHFVSEKTDKYFIVVNVEHVSKVELYSHIGANGCQILLQQVAIDVVSSCAGGIAVGKFVPLFAFCRHTQ